MMPVDRYGLTPKQRLFCEIYSRERNATQAAIEAGYSKSSAGSIGSENLQKPEIIKYLDFVKGKDLSVFFEEKKV